MRFNLAISAAAILLVAMPAGFSFAEDSHGQLPYTDAELYPSKAPQDLTMQEYLSQHHELIDLLRKNPNLINDPEFLKMQPRIQLFFKDHPDIAAKVNQNPAAFLQYANDTEPKLERGQNPNLEEYFAQHRDVAQALQKTPALIDDPQFVTAHPTLRIYLLDHPGVGDDFKANPNRYIHQDLQSMQ
jgi:hypothetical protein